MKKHQLLLLTLLIVAMLVTAGCSADVTVKEPGNNNNSSNNGDSIPTSSSPGEIKIEVDFNLNIDVEDGKDADGFVWEHNFSEITITGYIGSSNELTIPNTINGKPVTQIKKGAMKNFTGLKSVVIPGSVRTIEGVFEGCTGLETVVIAEQGLENMAGAFKDCTALKTVNVPATVKTMQYAFSGCEMLESVITIPAGVTSLEETFYHCAALKKVTMHNEVENLRFAFAGCKALTEVNISTGVTNLLGTFNGCKALKNVQIPEGITALEGTFVGCSSLETIVIPEGVQELDSTFMYCSALTNVNIPESVTRIESAFENCTSLRAILIPSCVTNMAHAFTNCTALENVSFAGEAYALSGSYYEDYRTDAFNGCTSLKKLELPAGIGIDGVGCIALEELTIHAVDEYPEEDGAFVYIDNYVSIRNLPALKKLEFVSEKEFEVWGFDNDWEEEYTRYIGDASWYETLLNEAQLATENGYRYYDETLDDGTAVRRIIKYDEDKSWSADEIPTTLIESRAQVGNQIIYTCYSPALFEDEDGNWQTGVVCYKTVETNYIEIYRPQYDEDICGTEAYQNCEYGKSITINGVSYPVELYEDSED